MYIVGSSQAQRGQVRDDLAFTHRFVMNFDFAVAKIMSGAGTLRRLILSDVASSHSSALCAGLSSSRPNSTS